ncbi:YfhJ family protein [Sutcliffiella halmapala]|uniref:YfhJ family protein n=1 Tax=Sutcliffiella halmapala TaxID=79882 RepID=UPI000995A15E|nr:YfhJ family protein [Sutcliffiella halmapala]
MDKYFERLTDQLLEKNPALSYEKARTWVEHLWEDFESTYARAGYKYKGKEMTERMVSGIIERHGESLHQFLSNNPKYKHLLDGDDFFSH